MVDKLWYDWQNANPVNFWSFAGGSVASPGDPLFPNGGPPFMNVRNLLMSYCSVNEPSVVLHTGPDGWYYEGVYRL